MSFVNSPLKLQETQRASHPFKLCNRCEEKRLPEGGMDMGNGRWICAACWTRRVTKPKGKNA